MTSTLIEIVVTALLGGGSFLYFFRKPAPSQPAQITPPGVVPAVMSAVNVGSIEGDLAKVLHKVLEDAEVKAVTDCIAEGIDLHDAKTIIARKHAYREKALDTFYGRSTL